MKRLLSILIAFYAIEAAADRLIPFSTSQSNESQVSPVLASAGTTAIAVWTEGVSPNRSVYASLFGSDGAPLKDRFLVSPYGENFDPAAASNGRDWLIVWCRRFFQSDTSVILARRVSADGTLLDSENLILDGGMLAGGPHVTSDGDDWLVIWTSSFLPSACGIACGTAHLYTTRVSSSGAVRDGERVPLPQALPRDQGSADVAWSGSAYVVSWLSSCRPNYKSFLTTWITAGTISPDLSRFDWTPITPDAGSVNPSYSNPRLAASGAQVLIAWTSNAGTTEYSLLDSSFVRQLVRQRAAGSRAEPQTLTGPLLGTGVDAARRFYIVTSDLLPGSDPIEWFVGVTTTPEAKPLKVNAALHERAAGAPLTFNGRLWLPVAIINAGTNEERLYVHEFD